MRDNREVILRERHQTFWAHYRAWKWLNKIFRRLLEDLKYPHPCLKWLKRKTDKGSQKLDSQTGRWTSSDSYFGGTKSKVNFDIFFWILRDTKSLNGRRMAVQLLKLGFRLGSILKERARIVLKVLNVWKGVVGEWTKKRKNSNVVE